MNNSWAAFESFTAVYKVARAGQGWPGPPLSIAQNGHPLTHDILERLDLLIPSSEPGNNHKSWDNVCPGIQQKLDKPCPPSADMLRPTSSDPESGYPFSPQSLSSDISAAEISQYDSPYTSNKHPPTSPACDFSNHLQAALPTSQEPSTIPSNALETSTTLDPSALDYTTWTTDLLMKPELFDASTHTMHAFETFDNFDLKAAIIYSSSFSPPGTIIT